MQLKITGKIPTKTPAKPKKKGGVLYAVSGSEIILLCQSDVDDDSCADTTVLRGGTFNGDTYSEGRIFEFDECDISAGDLIKLPPKVKLMLTN